ncbi:MAG: 3-phosphoshikimate 1-carboxyvinyltransferase [Candidatus Bathycorpusculaceae bacterium]
MAKLIVKRTEMLEGTVRAPPSKAYTHRAVIVASLSKGKSTIINPLECSDTEATVKACSMLGAKIKWSKKESSLIVKGFSKPKTPDDIIDCRGSGSTIRFLTSVCALVDGASVLTGDRSLRKRPMQPLIDALNQLGARCFSAKNDGKPPIIVLGGGVKGGEASLVGNVSSQFISSLLFAAPKAERDVRVEVKTPLESKSYVEMTLETLKAHCIKVECSFSYDRFTVPCSQEYTPTNHVIESDYSSAAFLLAAASVTNSKVRVTGLKKQTLQSDKTIMNIIKEMGVAINSDGDSIEVSGNGERLDSIDVDLKDSPDLVPVCAALACFAEGESVIRGVGRLRFKESDRVSTLVNELSKMGAKITASEDTMTIEGGAKLRGAHVCSHRDHRIAMTCVVAAFGAEGETVIHGIECVNKSYPNFVEDLKSLGGKLFGW